MSRVSLDSLSKSYGTVRALADVSLEVGDGELIALLGPSGCGKTTLLRVVAGLVRPDAGRVRFDHEDVTDRPTRERSIGLVFQSYALFPNLTVRQNVSFPLEVRRRPRDEVAARVDELLDLVHLTREADRYPSQISGGQAQRCALARALAPHPDVLLLDEPLSALDVPVRMRLRDEIRRVQRAVGTTTIYVTHDQSEALAIADRVAIMNHGRLEQLGAPRDVYAEPRSEFAARFVGHRNALEVDVRGGRAAAGALFDVAAADGDGRAICFFAPEDVSVAPASNGHAGQRTSVEAISFHGATTRLQLVATIGGRQIRVHADVASRQAAGYSPGDEVVAVVDARHVRCFSAGQS